MRRKKRNWKSKINSICPECQSKLIVMESKVKCSVCNYERLIKNHIKKGKTKGEMD